MLLHKNGWRSDESVWKIDDGDIIPGDRDENAQHTHTYVYGWGDRKIHRRGHNSEMCILYMPEKPS